MDGAASETGIRVVISIRYRPNSAALSDVPRAAITISRGGRALKRRCNARMVPNPFLRVFARALGCWRTSSSILDMLFTVEIFRLVQFRSCDTLSVFAHREPPRRELVLPGSMRTPREEPPQDRGLFMPLFVNWATGRRQAFPGSNLVPGGRIFGYTVPPEYLRRYGISIPS
jgi:hypothetical protein